MGKGIYLGLAPPDHPIFKEHCPIFYRVQGVWKLAGLQITNSPTPAETSASSGRSDKASSKTEG